MALNSDYPIRAEGERPVEVSHTDIDRQAAMLSGYNQSYEQLSAGRFVGKFLTCRYDTDFSVYVESVNRRLFQRFAVPGDQYAICIMMGVEDATHINGVMLADHQAMILSPGAEVVVATSAAMNICVVSVSRQFFEANLLYDAIMRGRQNRDILYLRDRHPNSSSQLMHGIGRSIDSLAKLSSNRSDEFLSRAHADKIAIVSAAQALFSNPQTVQAVARGDAAASRIDRFCAWLMAIDERISDMNSIDDIRDQVHASRRTVDTSFRKFLGTSPAQYIKAVRLNRVRRDLQSQDLRDLTIGDIAERSGISHLGRFSGEYRNLFGELPSETRRQATRI